MSGSLTAESIIEILNSSIVTRNSDELYDTITLFKQMNGLPKKILDFIEYKVMELFLMSLGGELTAYDINILDVYYRQYYDSNKNISEVIKDKDYQTLLLFLKPIKNKFGEFNLEKSEWFEGLGLIILNEIAKLDFEEYDSFNMRLIDIYYEIFHDNFYTDMGGNPVITTLRIKRLPLSSMKLILTDKSFFALVYDMIEKNYLEDDIRFIIERIQSELKENDILVINELIDRYNMLYINEDKSEEYKIVKPEYEIVRVLTEIKGGIYDENDNKEYVKNFNLTIDDIKKYEYVHIKDEELDIDFIIDNLFSSEGEKLKNFFIELTEEIKDINDYRNDVKELLLKLIEEETVENKVILDFFKYDVALRKIRLNEDIFRIFGPINPRVDKDDYIEVCKKFGGCRQFLCLCRTSDQYCEEERDDEEEREWFLGECEFCGLSISRIVNAVRKPNINGGWEGCYCSKECASDSIVFENKQAMIIMETEGTDKNIKISEDAKNVNQLINIFEDMKTKIGIQFRNDD